MVVHRTERGVPIKERLPGVRTEALNALVAVAAHGSISRAAVAMDEPKSSISRLIAELEAVAGATLLRRGRDGVTLTEAGEAMHDHALQVARLLDQAVAAAQAVESGVRGDVIVNAPKLFAEALLLPRLGEFLGAFPEVRLRLVSAARPAGDVDPTAHVSICVGPIPDVEMVKRRIGRSHLRIFAAPVVAAAIGRLEDPSVIAGPDLLGTPSTGNCQRLIDLAAATPALRLEIMEPQMRHIAVRQGLGAAWLPAFLCRDDVVAGTLIDVDPANAFGPIEIHALYEAHVGRLPRVRAFVDFLQRAVGTLT